MEALLHSVSNIALMLHYQDESKPLEEAEINHFLEEQSQVKENCKIVTETKHINIKVKLTTYPKLLAELLGNTEYSLEAGRHQEWNYLLNAIKVRDSIVHAKVKLNKENEIDSQVYVPECELHNLLIGYTWFLSKLVGISEVLEQNFKPFKETIESYSEQLDIDISDYW